YRPAPWSPLFPYTTLFGSAGTGGQRAARTRNRPAPAQKGSPRRLLVQSQQVAGRVEEGREGVAAGADRRHRRRHPAAGRRHFLERRVDAIDHDVREDAGFARRWPSLDPGAANGARRVIEGAVAVAAQAALPGEHLLIER